MKGNTADGAGNVPGVLLEMHFYDFAFLNAILPIHMTWHKSRGTSGKLNIIDASMSWRRHVVAQGQDASMSWRREGTHDVVVTLAEQARGDLLREWTDLSRPRRQGAVPAKPSTVREDFWPMVQRWLADRGVEDLLEHVGVNEG